ncbi:nuclear transport factor 2 family protein [Streptomyces sp. NBC_00525]|uniref:nuclear transport factor 2 family protein n=1 Tax=Streptomyces sp. NBC_00525 TaxID=2903660 RepID=UPI002E812BAE|nr:nuclear transport factor 2 family protein [Streptomyces sp. NBC_00525]WUC93393.1 nuclear transport factor 2 family protein [Streptomyces sp. NBC_00525]
MTNVPGTHLARRSLLGLGVSLGATTAGALLTAPAAHASDTARPGRSGHVLEQSHAGFPAMPRSVLGFFLASQRADADGWAAVFSHGAVFHDPVGQPPLIGRRAIRQRIASILPEFRPFLGITPREAHMTADHVAVSWHAAAVTRGDRPVNWSGINIFHLDPDGLIDACSAYFDLAVFQAQLAPSPEAVTG